MPKKIFISKNLISGEGNTTQLTFIKSNETHYFENQYIFYYISIYIIATCIYEGGSCFELLGISDTQF